MRATTLRPYARPRQTSWATISIQDTARVPSSLPLRRIGYCGEFNVFTSCSNIYCHCECETIESELRPPHFIKENECNVFNTIYVNLSGPNHLFQSPWLSPRWDCPFGIRSTHMPDDKIVPKP